MSNPVSSTERPNDYYTAKALRSIIYRLQSITWTAEDWREKMKEALEREWKELQK